MSPSDVRSRSSSRGGIGRMLGIESTCRTSSPHEVTARVSRRGEWEAAGSRGEPDSEDVAAFAPARLRSGKWSSACDDRKQVRRGRDDVPPPSATKPPQVCPVAVLEESGQHMRRSDSEVGCCESLGQPAYGSAYNLASWQIAPRGSGVKTSELGSDVLCFTHLVKNLTRKSFRLENTDRLHSNGKGQKMHRFGSASDPLTSPSHPLNSTVARLLTRQPVGGCP